MFFGGRPVDSTDLISYVHHDSGAVGVRADVHRAKGYYRRHRKFVFRERMDGKVSGFSTSSSPLWLMSHSTASVFL